jgi:SAM-dependent MidA family methyltransferase
LIAIVFANEIGNALPISAVDCVKEMFCVEANLMLGSPKPEQIYADAQRNGQHADSCSTKRNRHIVKVSQARWPTELITLS